MKLRYYLTCTDTGTKIEIYNKHKLIFTEETEYGFIWSTIRAHEVIFKLIGSALSKNTEAAG